MLRTYSSPVNEEEKELDKITVRKDYFAAIMQDYQSEMTILTVKEKILLIYAGQFMMYRQVLFFNRLSERRRVLPNQVSNAELNPCTEPADFSKTFLLKWSLS